MKRLKIALAASLSIALCTLPALNRAMAAPAQPDSGKNELGYKQISVNGEQYLIVNIAQLMDGRTARAMNIGGDWIMVTSKEGGFLPDPSGNHLVPKNPEIDSSLEIKQIYYRSSGDGLIDGFDGKYFTSCKPIPPGTKADEVRFPDDAWMAPKQHGSSPEGAAVVTQKIDKKFIGFKIDKKKACGAGIWAIVVRAPAFMQTKASNLEHLLIVAGNRLALDLQKARDLVYEIRWGLHYSSRVNGTALAQTLFQPFHDAVTDCLEKMGVDSHERPRDPSMWERFKLKIADFVERRSDTPRRPVTDPQVIAAMTNVYLESNFLIAELEGQNSDGVQPAIDSLRKLSDDLDRSLGFRHTGPGQSHSFYAVMDNATWIFDQLRDDHPYLGLTKEEKIYIGKMIDRAELIRKAAETDGDPTAAGFIRNDFREVWSGPDSEFFHHTVQKLYASRSDEAVDLQRELSHLSETLSDKCAAWATTSTGAADDCSAAFGLKGAH